ncbi:hypothetical protein U471_32500 [Bacillus amyloliquefaciens CC178]|nr:hypothetical protein U471_32500 [Bacillus amyloliquefaciens CC178]
MILHEFYPPANNRIKTLTKQSAALDDALFSSEPPHLYVLMKNFI